ncbi:MAG: hypothetical protein IJY28_09525 [Clostridia bacterium]|nr:hypothetical protein [Clostridia bacterium]
MKKLIFGCTLMLCGILGGNAWLLAQAVRIEPGAWSSMTNMFPLIGFGRPDGYIVLFFYAIAIVGTVVAIQALKTKN